MQQPDPVVALRVHLAHWYHQEHLDRLFAWLDQAPGTVDELAFFTSETHPPLPLTVMLDRAGRLREVIPQAKARGYGAGINLLAVLGHHEENLPGSLAGPYQRVVGPDGRECRGSFCPLDPGFQDYVRQVIKALAAARPDFLWIDDDVRLAGHGPLHLTCFCERCLGAFAAETGKPASREQMAMVVEGPVTPETLPVRLAWLEHNRGKIDGLFRLIRQAVDEVNPALSLGFMTGDRFYEGYAFARWAGTLAGPQALEVRWRPGGGFYADETPMELVSKAHDVGRQSAALPPRVRIVQYELENFPYHRLRKAAHTAAVESVSAMAAGCSGIALNILAMDPTGLGEAMPYLQRMGAARPFLDRLHAELGRSPTLGVWPAWNQQAWAAGSGPGGPYALAELGIPVCYGRGGATAVALAGSMPLAFSRDDLERMLTGGVLLDVEALAALWEMGLGHLCGVRPGAAYAVDAQERFLEHPLNDPSCGRLRDCRQSFWRQTAYTLEPMAEGVQVASVLGDYLGREHGPCLTVYENERGGRVAVAGYYPWRMITNLAKVHQYRQLALWLSGNRLPALVQSQNRVVVWVREGAQGRRAAVAINASLDPLPDLAVDLLTDGEQVEHVPMEGAGGTLPTAFAATPGYRRVVLRAVAPWSVHLLLYPRPEGG